MEEKGPGETCGPELARLLIDRSNVIQCAFFVSPQTKVPPQYRPDRIKGKNFFDTFFPVYSDQRLAVEQAITHARVSRQEAWVTVDSVVRPGEQRLIRIRPGRRRNSDVVVSAHRAVASALKMIS